MGFKSPTNSEQFAVVAAGIGALTGAEDGADSVTAGIVWVSCIIYQNLRQTPHAKSSGNPTYLLENGLFFLKLKLFLTFSR